MEPLIDRGLAYLATQQDADGGFGDTDLSHSNIATTMLVRAAFCLAGKAADNEHRELVSRSEKYIEAKGGIDGLRARYGKDKTFAVPILTNCALAGLVDWSEVNPLPFELAAFPQSWYRFFRLPVVSYAIPALVAIGQARFFHLPTRNPVVRTIRRAAIKRTLKVLARMQPESGGYLEAIPLTSFVVMSLAGTGRADHPVARRGVRFLLDTVRPDGSWPIDTNLATWVTTLAANALVERRTAAQVRSGTQRHELSPKYEGQRTKDERNTYEAGTWNPEPETVRADRVVDWLLSCQHTERHPFTGAAPGGWGWSDLSGAVPDVDDTSGALLALSKWANGGSHHSETRLGSQCAVRGATRAVDGVDVCGRQARSNQQTIERAARLGVEWLVSLQNRDGGWPTFCRGWGTLPFDRSSPDLTAHACRAIRACLPVCDDSAGGRSRWLRQIERGIAYLKMSQRSDGSWVPLWFGNQDRPNEENPVYGTSRVLLAYRDLGRIADDEAIRALHWLVASQNNDGGWGNASPKSQVPFPTSFEKVHQTGIRNLGPETSARRHQPPASGLQFPVLNTRPACGSSVEETAWAVEALLAGLDNASLAADNSLRNAIQQGTGWLASAVEDGRHRHPSPVGFYFAKLWYYEKLYPLIFTVAALGEAVACLDRPRERVDLADSAHPTELTTSTTLA